ncbi:unnamed protein product, partial [Linum tenue]
TLPSKFTLFSHPLLHFRSRRQVHSQPADSHNDGAYHHRRSSSRRYFVDSTAVEARFLFLEAIIPLQNCCPTFAINF